MPAEIRFHLDECVPGAVAEGLRRRRIDVTTTPESALISAVDRDQLAFASKEGRVLVTKDSDFLGLALRTRAWFTAESRTTWMGAAPLAS